MDPKKINLAKISHDAFHAALPSSAENEQVFDDLPDAIKGAWMNSAMFVIMAFMEEKIGYVDLKRYYADQAEADADAGADYANYKEMSGTDGS